MIRRITIENFMAHSRTVIEPADGLTVLVGPNNCGKSAVVAALQALCRNEAGQYMIRHEADAATVTVETADGHTIVWRKNRKQAASYTLDGRAESRLRGHVPESLHVLLRLPLVETERDSFDVHFGEQKSPIFLLDKSPSQPAVFFASANDARLLLEMQRRHKQKVTDRRREGQHLRRQIEHTQAELAALEPVDELNRQLAAAEKSHVEWADEQDRMAVLEDATDRLVEVLREFTGAERVCQSLLDLRSPPQLADTASLQSVLTRIDEAMRRRDVESTRHQTLLRLAAPPVLPDTLPLQSLVRRFIQMQSAETCVAAMDSAVASLAAPPVLADPAPLTSHCRAMAEAHRQARAGERRLASLDPLTPPPAPADPVPLAALVEQFHVTIAESERLTSELRRLDANLESTVSDIRDWAVRHPICPTCGGAIDADRILAGSHAHA